jgi:Fe-S oxidoreductase
MIKEVHARVQNEEGHPIKSLMLAKVLKNRKLFHTLLRSAKLAQKPVTGGTPYLRHLPQIFAKKHNFRALPAIAEKPFRDRWSGLRPKVREPLNRVALFSGCVQDFVYPEQLEAAVRLMADQKVAMDFPMQQTCCGLPVAMMAEKEAARDVARQNVTAMDLDGLDHIVTLCASCASHLKHAYPRMLAGDPELSARAEQFAAKVVPFSVFMQDVLQVSSASFRPMGQKTTYHAPCHLCRGLDVVQAPRQLILASGADFLQAAEEQTCCGFGGTYSSKFPEISAQILSKKLDDAVLTGAELLVTECPGCVMQLRGGARQRRENIEVIHLAELMARNKRQTP